MVRNNSLRNLNVPVITDIAGCGLQEEEGLLWDLVIQLANMVCVVAANCYDL